MSLIRVAVLSPVRAIGESLANSLSEANGFNVLAVVTSVEALFQAACRQVPRAIVVDSRPAESLSGFGRFSAAFPETYVFVVGSDAQQSASSVRNAAAFLGQEATLEELRHAIRAVAIDVPTLVMPEGWPDEPEGANLRNQIRKKLTERQVQILLALSKGKSNKEIATQFGISVATVKNHLHEIYDRIGVCRRGEATAFAITHGRILDDEHDST